VGTVLTSVQRPPPPQKYYLVVNLVRITSVDELVKALENRVEPKETAIDKSTFQNDCWISRKANLVG
jgi:hypothetical protein